MRVLLPLEAGQSAYTRNVGCAKNMKKHKHYTREILVPCTVFTLETPKIIFKHIYITWDMCVCVDRVGVGRVCVCGVWDIRCMYFVFQGF